MRPRPSFECLRIRAEQSNSVCLYTGRGASIVLEAKRTRYRTDS